MVKLANWLYSYLKLKFLFNVPAEYVGNDSRYRGDTFLSLPYWSVGSFSTCTVYFNIWNSKMRKVNLYDCIPNVMYRLNVERHVVKGKVPCHQRVMQRLNVCK